MEHSDSEKRIVEAVEAWLQNSSDAADLLQRLDEQERCEALIRLGYNTPTHLAMFGLA